MSAPSTTDRRYRSLEIVAALVLLALLWIDVGLGVRWYPTWLSLGPVTLSVTELPSVAFGLLVLARLRSVRANDGTWTGLDWLAAVLGALTLLAAVYAAATLNLGRPGLYVAGVIPIAFALLLGVVEAVAAVRVYRR